MPLAVVALSLTSAPPAGAVARAHAAGGPCPGASLRPDPRNTAAVERATLCLINQIRVAHGLLALRANRTLLGVAVSQVSTMVSRNYFADVRPSGQTPLTLVVRAHYPANAADVAVGQNIAWGTAAFSTPANIVNDWMASAPHRAVILTGEYRDAAVAVESALPVVLDAGRHGAIYAMEFGARLF